MKLSPQQKDVVSFLNKRPRQWVKPAVVGELVGGYHWKEASPWGSRNLRKLVRLGLVEKDLKTGYFRIKSKA